MRWWLQWIEEFGSNDSWIAQKLGSLLGTYGNDQATEALIELFNSSTEFRGLLASVVLPHVAELNTNIFSEDAISFLLADLERHASAEDHLLALSATETFVEERLLPLSRASSGQFAASLREVIYDAGKRHGRRYPLD